MKPAALFAVLIIAIVLLADANKLPWFIHALYNIPYGDKFGHFALFGILNFLLTRGALSSLRDRAPKRVAWTTGILLALLIGLEEYSQNFFPSRTPDWLDFFPSCLGIACGGMLAYRRIYSPGLGM